MNKFYFICLVFSVCTSAVGDSKSDSLLEKALIGKWEWTKTYEGCEQDGVVAFKSNGTYTITSEDCEMSDDGFGNFFYGWYVANNFICMAYDERQADDVKPTKAELKQFLKNKKMEGYNKQDCGWEIVSHTSKTITIRHRWDDEGKFFEETFTLNRSRWLH